jgi:hypothetical protein
MGGEENDMERERSGASSSSSSLSVREPLLLSRRITNNTSQLAIVGANVCPIESLDYEYDHSAPQNLFFFIIFVILLVL